MRSSNLSLLSSVERRKIELQRQASLLIYNMRKGSVSRSTINAEINKLEGSDHELFRYYLNFYSDKSK